MTHLFQWLSEAWLSSIVRTISLGGVAIVVFWLIDRVCQSLDATQRSWLWRLLYIKLASLLFCSFTVLSLPTAAKFWSVPSTESVVTIGGSASGFSAFDLVQAHPQSNYAEGIPQLSLLASVSPNSQHWPAWPLVLAIAWLVGALGLASVAFSRYRRLLVRLRKATVPTDSGTAMLYRTVLNELGIGKGPELVLVTLDCSPCLVWDRRTCIVLPVDFRQRFGKEACRMAMAHELGHFVRRDLQWNALAALVSTWLFFFPLIWLMNKRYRIALEMACDAYTIDRARVDRIGYANLLVGLLDSRSRWAASATFVAMAGSGSFRSLSARLNAMKFRKQSHVWLRRLSLGAAGCVVGASLLPWGFASDDEPKQKKKAKSNAETRVESNVQVGSSSSSDGVVTSVVTAGEPGGTTFSFSTGDGGSINTSSSSAGTGSSAGSGSSSSASSTASGQKKQESVSKSINTVDGKRTMTVAVTTNSRAILIHQDAKGTFRVEIQEATEGDDVVKKSYVADSRKEFAKVHPEVYESIKAYLQDNPPVAPVAPVASVASTSLKHSVVAGAQSPVAVAGMPLNLVQSPNAVKVEGKPLSRAVAGVALAPSVPSVPSVRAIAGVPAAPSVPAIPSVPAVPSIPSAPSAPALPALEGVLEALDKIRSESAGNVEIEKLIESIKAKLNEKE